MLRKWDQLYQDVHDVCCPGAAESSSSRATPPHPHLLRFFAHLMVILRRLDIQSAKQHLDEDILKAYIGYLVSCSRVHQVAWYTAQLSTSHQVEVYSGFMMTVKNEEDRR